MVGLLLTKQCEDEEVREWLGPCESQARSAAMRGFEGVTSPIMSDMRFELL